MNNHSAKIFTLDPRSILAPPIRQICRNRWHSIERSISHCGRLRPTPSVAVDGQSRGKQSRGPAFFHFGLGVVTGTEMSSVADWIAAVHPPMEGPACASAGFLAIHSMTSFAGTSRTENEGAGSRPERICEPSGWRQGRERVAQNDFGPVFYPQKMIKDKWLELISEPLAASHWSVGLAPTSLRTFLMDELRFALCLRHFVSIESLTWPFSTFRGRTDRRFAHRRVRNQLCGLIMSVSV